jgi:AraC-like DNA-binding protein
LAERSGATGAEVARRLAQLWREAADDFTPAAPPVGLANAVQEFLATHLAERVRLQDLARTLGYSPSHVSAVIHRMTGRRFTQLRREMQLERAMFLLRRCVPVKRSALDSTPGSTIRRISAACSRGASACRRAAGLRPPTARSLAASLASPHGVRPARALVVPAWEARP